MAQQLAPHYVAPNVCSQPIYAPFMKLQDFAPAVEFCRVFQAKSEVQSTSGCPQGNVLCSILSSLSKYDRAFISTVCSCIGGTPSMTISVPKTSSTQKSETKKNPKTTPVQSPTVMSSPTKMATSETYSMAIVSTTSAPAPVSTTSAPAPVCSNGIRVVTPAPDGLICQQRGLLFPPNEWDDTTRFGTGGGFATSELDCAQQCITLNWECGVSQFNPDTGACLLFLRSAMDEAFVANDMSPTVVSDQMCFEEC